MPLPAQTLDFMRTLGTSPAITWYSDEGRIELSGKVFTNHVAKIANYLANAVGIEPADSITIALPASWRALTWTLGALQTGAHIYIGTDFGPQSVQTKCVITDHPENFETPDIIIAVTTASLAFAWPGELPFYAEDGVADAMVQPDALQVFDRDSEARINNHRCEEWLATLNLSTFSAQTRMCTVASTLPEAIASSLNAFQHHSTIVVVTGSATARIEEIAQSENASFIKQAHGIEAHGSVVGNNYR